MSDETVSIQKCKCGQNFVLTIAGLKCPKCDLIKPKRPYTKKEGVKYGRPKKIDCNNHPAPTVQEQEMNKEGNRS